MKIDDVITYHGDKIHKMGLGRERLAVWLNENLDGTYTEHFARRLLEQLPKEPYKVDPKPPTGDANPPRTRSMEEILRESYGLSDPTWVPVSVWGDPRNPRAKWERRLDLLDAERMSEIVDSLTGGDLDLPSYTEDLASERLAVLSIRDMHFGMFTEHPGDYERYDLDEAKRAYEGAAASLMKRALGQGVQHLVIPFGSDALHVDGPQGATTRGTPQQVSTAWNLAFRAALEALSNVLNAASESFERVTLVLEPGNHDNTLSQALGIAVQSKYDGVGNVEVIAGAETLKRVSLGNTHLFFHHGDSMKPNSYHGVIYSDYPECAKDGAYIEVMSGHLHHRRKTVLLEPGDYLEESGIVFRITPALCPSSNWAESQGYRSKAGAQLTIYDEYGFDGMFEWSPRRGF